MRSATLRRATRILLVSFVLAIPVLVLALFLSKLPEWEQQIQKIPEAKDRIATQNELFKTILQIAGGSVLIIGFYFTWKTIHVSQEGQITDRFNKAVDHLGQANMSVRLGGIYALARIASDSEKDAPTVTQILTAFVREATASSSLIAPAQDVKSILTLLGSENWAKATPKDLSECKLHGLELKNADLKNWNFGNADLSEANLEGSLLDGATVSGANLQNAYLRKCSMKAANLTAADLAGCALRHANLESANIFGAILDSASLFSANFKNATGAVRQQFELAIYDDTTILPQFRTDLD